MTSSFRLVTADANLPEDIVVMRQKIMVNSTAAAARTAFSKCLPSRSPRLVDKRASCVLAIPSVVAIISVTPPTRLRKMPFGPRDGVGVEEGRPKCVIRLCERKRYLFRWSCQKLKAKKAMLGVKWPKEKCEADAKWSKEDKGVWPAHGKDPPLGAVPIAPACERKM